MAAPVETVLYSFNGGSDGDRPYGGLILDKEGALYGTTVSGGSCTRVTHELLCHSIGDVLRIADDTITATTNTPGYTMTLSAPEFLVLPLACKGLTGSNVSFKATIEMVSLAGN